MNSLIKLMVFTSSICFASVPIVSGKLELPKKLTANAKGIRTIFLSVYDAKSAAPMPCAAQKITLEKDASGEFLTFTADDSTLMLMGCPAIPEQMRLKVKLDKDDNAGPDASGDIVGLANNVKKGTKGLKISLDKLIP